MIQSMTAPCPPQNIHTSVGCENRTAYISWTHSQGALSYTARLHRAGGEAASCSSNATGCDITSLPCGETYTVTVAAEGHTCNSSQSSESSIKTAPCVPSAPVSNLSCSTNMAAMTWNSSLGANLYSVVANSSAGHSGNCQSAGLSCELTTLLCGQTYTVTVTAQDSMCTSASSQSVEVKTEPCVPMYLSVSYSLSIAQLFWDMAKGASSYSAQAITDQGLTVSCHTNDTYCDLPGMACGQIYNVTVSASNSACNSSVTTKPYILMTEPCPPTNVQASMDCNTLTASVSWEASDVAVGYTVVLGGQDGHSIDCLTTTTSCDMGGLNCGTVYHVYVRALGVQFNSSVSSGVSLSPAPCLPSSVQAQVDCGSDGAALLSWSYTDGANNYTLSANGVEGEVVSCTTQQNHCNVTGLSCGGHYNVTLTATNQECQITVPINASFDTRPCAPQHVAVDLTCGTQIADLSWEERSEVELYVSSAARWSDG
uniref:Fibronectin type-III domain-containing protein n=1 Tax=Oncorhynchus tshawytscha TaxID=74940 RepID=A0AAZ3P4N4_ONCTS